MGRHKKDKNIKKKTGIANLEKYRLKRKASQSACEDPVAPEEVPILGEVLTPVTNKQLPSAIDNMGLSNKKKNQRIRAQLNFSKRHLKGTIKPKTKIPPKHLTPSKSSTSSAVAPISCEPSTSALSELQSSSESVVVTSLPRKRIKRCIESLNSSNSTPLKSAPISDLLSTSGLAKGSEASTSSDSDSEGSEASHDEDFDIAKDLCINNNVAKRKEIVNRYKSDNFDLDSMYDNSGYCLIHFDTLNKLLKKKAVCKKCNKSVTLSKVERKGTLDRFGSTCKISCNECMTSTTSKTCPTTVIHKKVHSEANVLFTLGMLGTGLSHERLKQFYSFYNMATPGAATHNTITEGLWNDMNDFRSSLLDQSRSIVKKYYKDKYGNDCLVGDNVKITVSYNSSRMSKGINSKIGIGLVMDVETNLIVDYHVLSLYCNKCKINEKKLSKSKFEMWKTIHIEEDECMQNFQENLSSGSMEIRLVEILWLRSEENGLLYTKVHSNSNFNEAYDHLCFVDIYNGLKIEKEENVNQSFDSQIWKICSQNHFRGRKAVECALFTLTGKHNFGFERSVLGKNY